MSERSDYVSDDVVEIIVSALNDAYEGNRLNFEPSIGNSAVSFGVSVWQSTLFFLEQGFGGVSGATVHRSGSTFRIDLSTCSLTFYKFGSGASDLATDFRLDPRISRTRQHIVSSNQMSLFNYAAHPEAAALPTRDLVVIHSGNPYDGLLEVHVGAAISEKRYEEGWLWLSPLYIKDLAENEPVTIYNELPEAEVSVEPLVAAESYDEVEEYDTPLFARDKSEQETEYGKLVDNNENA